MLIFSRRDLIAAAGALAALPAWAAAPAGGRLAFAVWRNGEKIGDHRMTFAHGADAVTVTTEVAMAFRIGPLKINYAHNAKERWTDETFDSLLTTTTTNGKRERVAAGRAEGAVFIETASGSRTVAAATAPLTHWNLAALQQPLFNPQNGKLLKASVSRSTLPLPGAPPTAGASQRWSLRGQAEIDDWYDAAGVWCGLRGRLPDRSLMEYRQT